MKDNFNFKNYLKNNPLLNENEDVKEGMFANPQDYQQFLSMLPALAPMVGLALYKTIKDKVVDYIAKKKAAAQHEPELPTAGLAMTEEDED